MTVKAFTQQTGKGIVYLVLAGLLLAGLVLSLTPPQITDAAGEPASGGGSEAVPAVDLPPGVSPGWWAAVQEDIRRSEYHITWQERTYLEDLEAAYQVPNRAHNLRTYFTPQGIRVIPRVFEGESPPWEWGLTLTGYGYAGQVGQVAPVILNANGNRIEYRRGPLTEWYLNDERGLEQGFTLREPPPGSGEQVVLELALGGDLTPHLASEGEIEFTTAGGVTVLRYSDLLATDATGRRLPARMELARIGDGQYAIRLIVDAAGAVYPITVDPLATTPNWTAEGDQDGALFGWSVSTAGDVNGDGYSDVIVGAPYYTNCQSRCRMV